MNLNEQLATEVMDWHDVHDWGHFWAEESGRMRSLFEQWNPVEDLNQLKQCYEQLKSKWENSGREKFEQHFSDALWRSFNANQRMNLQPALATVLFCDPILVAKVLVVMVREAGL